LPSAQTYLAEAAPLVGAGCGPDVIYLASVGGQHGRRAAGPGPLGHAEHGGDDRVRLADPVPLGGVLGLVPCGSGARWREARRSRRAAAVDPVGRPRIWPRSCGTAGGGPGRRLTVGFTVVYYPGWSRRRPTRSATEDPPTAALLAGVLSSLVLMACGCRPGVRCRPIGRRPVLLISCLGTAVLLFPLQAMVHDAVRLGSDGVAMVFIGAGVAILPAAYAESSRPTFVAVGSGPYSIAVAVSVDCPLPCRPGSEHAGARLHGYLECSW